MQTHAPTIWMQTRVNPLYSEAFLSIATLSVDAKKCEIRPIQLSAISVYSNEKKCL